MYPDNEFHSFTADGYVCADIIISRANPDRIFVLIAISSHTSSHSQTSKIRFNSQTDDEISEISS